MTALTLFPLAIMCVKLSYTQATLNQGNVFDYSSPGLLYKTCLSVPAALFQTVLACYKGTDRQYEASEPVHVQTETSLEAVFEISVLCNLSQCNA